MSDFKHLAAGKFNFVASVAVILERDGKVLLMRRENTGFGDGLHVLPTGYVEGGESLRDAACREIDEELGVKINPDHLELACIAQSVFGDAGTKKELLHFFYRAASWEGEPYNREPDKCTAIEWTDKNAMPDTLILSSRAAIGAAPGKVLEVTYPLNDGRNVADLTKLAAVAPKPQP